MTERSEQRPVPEQEKEIKPGKYELSMEIEHYSGEKKTHEITEISVFEGQYRDDVIKNARSWLVMAGAHNYGMKYRDKEIGGEKRGVGEVKLIMKSAEDGSVIYESDFNIDGSGYIVE